MIRIARECESDEDGPADDAGILSLRARKEFKDYVHRLATMERVSVSVLIDRSLTEYAQRHVAGIGAPPPRR